MPGVFVSKYQHCLILHDAGKQKENAFFLRRDFFIHPRVYTRDIW